MHDILDNAVIYLIREDRFYAEMLHRMTKTESKDIETMGVSVDTKGVHLWVNPFFLKSLTVPEQAEVLKHECEHPMRGHFERERTGGGGFYNPTENQTFLERIKNASHGYMLNLAEDYAINETLPKLPKKFNIFDKEGNAIVDPETGKVVECAPALVDDLIAMFPEEKIQRNQAMEYYFSFLKQKKEEGKFSGTNQSGYIIAPVDNHDMLKEALEKIDPKFAKKIVQDLANEAKASTPGKIPSHIEVLIDNLNKSTHDWRKDLRMFRAMCTTVYKRATRLKRNRRYGFLYPGKKKKTRLHLVAAFDSSASVWQKALDQFYSELEPMADEGVDITVIECDATVQQVFKYDSKRVPKAKGRGGTSFAPVFNLVNSSEFLNEYGTPDGLVYFTDGEDWGDIKQPKFPVLWALFPGKKSRYTWGRKTVIEVND